VSVSGFTIRGFEIGGKDENKAYAIEVVGARDATITQNRVVGNVTGGINVGRSIDTTVEKNHVIGNPKTEAGGIRASDGSRNTKMVNNEVSNIPEDQTAIEANEAIGTTMVGNDLENNGIGLIAFDSTGTKIVSNDITDSIAVGTLILDSTGTKIVSNDIHRSGDTGIAMFGPERANNDAKVVGNRISGGPWGIYVERAHGGSFTGNQVHDNCAGMFFVAYPSQPVGDFKVTGNTVDDNSQSCRAAQFGINFSGIGIALLGAREMEVTGNQISGNVPSGPTIFSGGVAVVRGPDGTAPRNNTVTGNTFGRNKPDIFWDESGTGNRFADNRCDKSVPSSLCS
jgi:nitrous oxidase accessory protein NosD